MNSLTMILAEQQYDERLEGLRKAFTHEQQDTLDFQPIILLAVGIAVFGLFVYIFGKVKMRTENYNAPRRPLKLLTRVLKTLGVGYVDRALMRFVAIRSQLPHPAVMLLNQELFQKHAHAWADHLSLVPLRGGARHRLEAVAEKIFPREPVTI